MLYEITNALNNAAASFGLKSCPILPPGCKFTPTNKTYENSGGKGTLVIDTPFNRLNVASQPLEIYGFLGQDGKFISNENSKENGFIVYCNKTAITRIYNGEISLYNQPMDTGILKYPNFTFTGKISADGMATAAGKITLVNDWECECHPNSDGTIPQKPLKFDLPNGWKCECQLNSDGTIPNKPIKFTLPNGWTTKCQLDASGNIPQMALNFTLPNGWTCECIPNFDGTIPQRILEFTSLDGQKYTCIPNPNGTIPSITPKDTSSKNQKYQCVSNAAETIANITPKAIISTLQNRNCNVNTTNTKKAPNNLKAGEYALSHSWKYIDIPNTDGTIRLIAPNGKEYLDTLHNFNTIATEALDKEVASLITAGIQKHLV